MDEREGADKTKALGRRMRAVEPDLKKLQRQLEKARRLEESSPPAKGPDAAGEEKRVRETAKKAKSEEVLERDESNLLAKLDSL
jgi:hypothetical protein